jgi:plastocyanin domain-containing protein
MGGMMGSMLGVMLQPQSTDFMIYFIDIVYVAVMVLLIRLIDEEARTNNQETVSKKTLVANPIILLGILVFMGVLVFGKDTFLFGNDQQSSSEVKEIKFTDTSSEIHDIIVKPSEYSPNNIVVKAGTPAILNFKTKEVGCTGTVLSDELGFNVNLY